MESAQGKRELRVAPRKSRDPSPAGARRWRAARLARAIAEELPLAA